MSIPASVRAMTRARPFIPGSDVTFPAPSPFPLRCADGRTFAERAAANKKEHVA
jgi:hypothetical protein